MFSDEIRNLSEKKTTELRVAYSYTHRNGVIDFFSFLSTWWHMLRHKLKTHTLQRSIYLWRKLCCFLRNHLCSLAVAMQQFIHSACQQGTEGTMTHAVTLFATVMFTWEVYSLACSTGVGHVSLTFSSEGEMMFSTSTDHQLTTF